MPSERGVTLLETLLAFAIGGLLLATAYRAVVRAEAARDHAVGATAGVVAGRRALLDIARAVEAAAPRPFAADAQGLRVAHGDPTPRLLGWALERGQLVEHQASPFATGDGGTTRALLDGVQAFDVRCFDDGAWSAGWRGERAPRAVELALQLASGERLRTRVVLAQWSGG